MEMEIRGCVNCGEYYTYNMPTLIYNPPQGFNRKKRKVDSSAE